MAAVGLERGVQHGRLAELTGEQSGSDGGQTDSRGTSPGGLQSANRHGDSKDDDGDALERVGRTRPRVFPYAQYLPYETESRTKCEQDLDEIIKHLYIALAAGDFSVGATHWTREIRGWMGLKFDLTKRQRIVLVKLYYELAMAPGLEYSTAERFASMFMVLTKRKHYLRPGVDLTLDWRPLFKELKTFVLPSETSSNTTYGSKRNVRTLTKLCTFAQMFFDPREIPAMFEELLPLYSLSFSEHAYIVSGLFNLMLPTTAPPSDDPKLQPEHYLPTFFHLWSTVSRSMSMDTRYLDLFSRIARDCLGASHMSFGPYGLFTETQSSHVYTAILRLLEIPVGQSSSPYSSSVEIGAGNGLLLERDPRKHPVSHSIARWIVMSLSPRCLAEGNAKSTLHQLEALIQGIETFFHPSNSGAWTKALSQLVYYLADFFVMRWNRERSGEYDVPADRQLDERVRHRFVRCLRDVVFMSIYAKSPTAMNYGLSALQSLAYLEPDLILPGALQRIYPAMQGLVEVHRTISSIRALQMLSRIMARTKGYRCHLTTLLGLALPGIDANDLDKTMHTLAFIQSVCYNIPLHDLTREPTRQRAGVNDDVDMDEREASPGISGGTGLAIEWITAQVAHFEQEGPMIEIDYSSELTDEDEELILKSSTAGFSEFIMSFIGRVFTLLQNLPDAVRVKSGSPEENVVNTLPATFSPLLASLSPDLYEIALEHIARFISNHVVHQARDAMAFICNALVKVSPKRALARLLPDILASIRTEITENGAGSTRTTGSEILPRDRALVWHVSLLSMCVVHVGRDVLSFKDELFDIANFMQEHCKGIPLVHVSNFVHHLLLNLTVAYTIDYGLYNQSEILKGVSSERWGQLTDPTDLEIQWHVPDQEELDFAVKIAEAQSSRAFKALEGLISGGPAVKRDGVGKDWSDEVSRNLVLLRLIVSGLSRLFRSDDVSISPYTYRDAEKHEHNNDGEITSDEALVNNDNDEYRTKRTFAYSTGYPLQVGSRQYVAVHDLRKRIGETLHSVHAFLVENQQDDVQCFNSLYTAYKAWFIDIGIERSAHVLDRLTRLLTADQSPFKMSGQRKQYPRPLLVRRANLYHFQRLRFNEHPRVPSELDKVLLLDLTHSATSNYTEIRRTAQSAGDQALKSIVGAKAIVVNPLLEAMEDAVKQGDDARIKGAIYSLLLGSLSKTISRNWTNASRLIKLFIDVSDADRPSIQKLVAQSSFAIQGMTTAMDRMVILDENNVRQIWPEGTSEYSTIARTIEDAESLVRPIKARITKRHLVMASKRHELAQELISVAKRSHWKKASRTAVVIISLDYRFETIASSSMLELVVKGVIDSHPQLRTLYATSMNAVCSLVQTRAICAHMYENYLLDDPQDPDEIFIPTERDDPTWTERHLASFAQPHADYYVDSDFPGWLVWGKTMRAFNVGPSKLEYDDLEQSVRKQMGQYIDRTWLSTLFGYMKQEPRDQHADRFRMHNSMLVSFAMDLMAAGYTKVTWEDFKDLTQAVFGDGSDQHQHRAMSEIMSAMVQSSESFDLKLRTEVWEFMFPLVQRILSDGLTPENISYWSTFVTITVGGKDPRRSWPLVDWLAGFRLDMGTNAAFKESSKIQLLALVIGSLGWHFQLDKPIFEDFLQHLDHPYKGVREVVGSTLSIIHRTRFHESYSDVETLLEAQRGASSIGKRPFPSTEIDVKLWNGVFQKLAQWRKERPPGIQTPTPYTQACKTVLIWLDNSLSAFDCTALVPFFPDVFMEELLHMMDIKEDPELQSLAYLVFRHLPNVPHQQGEEEAFVAALIRIGRSSTSWHQRLRILINIQVVYFRHLFMLSTERSNELLDCVKEMLHDVQLEVRLGAAATLGGMVRCSPTASRNEKVAQLKKHFTDLLVNNPLPKRPRGGVASTGTSTPTHEQNRLVLTRHAAVLGLGALIQAFPYMSPPPEWLPEVLATLAGKAAGDPGMVGKSVKSILSDFKKTRQDTWQIDVKAFKQEQLEDLEGVLWKSYFA